MIRQADQIQRINRTKDRLYSVIAHDIKSPFSNISMLISTLAEGYLEPNSEEYDEILQSINNSSQETYALLENLLQWTRSQTGDLELSPESIDLSRLLNDVLRFLEPVAKKKGIAMHVDAPDQLEMMADRNMMRSVVQNLAGNAIKFTNEGGKIVLKAMRKNDSIVVVVQDDGIGISGENIKRLFVDEGQLTTRGTRDEKGSGLGLLLVKDFVQRHDGKIEVNSKLGEGTSFRLHFPPQ